MNKQRHNLTSVQVISVSESIQLQSSNLMQFLVKSQCLNICFLLQFKHFKAVLLELPLGLEKSCYAPLCNKEHKVT